MSNPNLGFPVEGGKVSSGDGFGWRPDPNDSSKQQFHNGQDIKRPLDEKGSPITGPVPILAAQANKVVETGKDTRGNYVTIQHGPDQLGLRTEYFHMEDDSLKVKVGDVVERGQLIGIMGNTGNSTGEHLHFGVLRKGGVGSNPSVNGGWVKINPERAKEQIISYRNLFVRRGVDTPVKSIKGIADEKQVQSEQGSESKVNASNDVPDAEPNSVALTLSEGASDAVPPTPVPTDDSIAAVQAYLSFRDKLAADGIVGIGVGQELQDAFVRTMGEASRGLSPLAVEKRLCAAVMRHA